VSSSQTSQRRRLPRRGRGQPSGVGTDLTNTQPPRLGAGSGISFGVKQQIKQARTGQLAAGTKINDNELQNAEYGTLSSGQFAAVSRQQHVTAAAGALALSDITVTGTVPAITAAGGPPAASAAGRAGGRRSRSAAG
jgi:hypothetical protein